MREFARWATSTSGTRISTRERCSTSWSRDTTRSSRRARAGRRQGAVERRPARARDADARGRRRSRASSSEPPLIVPARRSSPTTATERRGHPRRAIRSYRHSLPPDRRVLLERFRYVDLARKVVGVGSVGTRCWVLLMLGRDEDDPLFLQIKEAEASVLEPLLGASGSRTTASASSKASGSCRLERHLPRLGARRRTSTVRCATSTCGSFATGRSHSTSRRSSRPGCVYYGTACGWTLARAHARSGDRIAIAVVPWSERQVRPGRRGVRLRLRRPERARSRSAPASGHGRQDRRARGRVAREVSATTRLSLRYGRLVRVDH